MKSLLFLWFKYQLAECKRGTTKEFGLGYEQKDCGANCLEFIKVKKKGYKNKNKRFTDNNNSKPESIATTNAFLYILSAIYNLIILPVNLLKIHLVAIFTDHLLYFIYIYIILYSRLKVN